MEPWQEPVRGAPPPPGVFALPGIEQIRGIGRLWPPLPLFHLTGVRATQVSHGSVVLSMPVTPWIAHPDGAIDAGLMAVVATSTAAQTTVRPGQIVQALQLSYSPTRRIAPDSSTIVGRAHVLRTAPYWVYAEGVVEDGEGRIVAGTTGHFLVADVGVPVPEEPPPFAPIDLPTYATPDPHARPLHADQYAAFNLFPERGGAAAVQAMIDGESPRAPVYQLFGIRPVQVGEGHYTAELQTSDWLMGADGHVHPGILTSFCSDACGAATWARAGPGIHVATLNGSFEFSAPIPCDGRKLRTKAEAEWLGDKLVSAKARLYDGDVVVGTGSATTLILERVERGGGSAETRSREPSARILATVMFTDIVDSTAQASQAGDARWGRILSDHHEIVRLEIGRARGRVVKTTGDGVLATFDSPTLALECAKAIRRAVARLGVVIRAGLHTGDVEISGGDIAGIAVHVASRVESAAGPGELWVSETVRTLAAGTGHQFKDQGRHSLKGIDGEVQLYSVEE